MARADKVGTVTELTERLRGSSASLLTEYRGLTVSQMTQLRRSLGAQTTYEVVKNTLTKRAAKDAELELDDALFTGPTAIAFVGGDPVEAAKGVRDFAKANPALVLKGGVMDGRFMTVEEVTKLADLESREVLLARLAGGMKASLTQAAALFQAPLAQTARLAAALQEKKSAESENSAGTEDSTAGTPENSAGTENSASEENTTGEDESESAEPAAV